MNIYVISPKSEWVSEKGGIIYSRHGQKAVYFSIPFALADKTN
jgi:hypothetical protein